MCVAGLYVIIIKHRDAGAGAELWCVELKREKLRENMTAERERKEGRKKERKSFHCWPVQMCKMTLTYCVTAVLPHTQLRWKAFGSFQGNGNNNKVFFPVIVNFTVSGWV